MPPSFERSRVYRVPSGGPTTQARLAQQDFRCGFIGFYAWTAIGHRLIVSVTPPGLGSIPRYVRA